MNHNILLPEDGPARRSCEWCHARTHVIDAFYVCLTCGTRKAVESKPESRLASVEDGNALLVQPGKNVDELEDMPAGAQLVKEIDLHTGVEITGSKRRISHRESADVVLFR